MIRSVSNGPKTGVPAFSRCRQLVGWSVPAISLLFSQAASGGENNYTGNLRNILGDVKQGQITNALDAEVKIDKVLDGFEKLGCNGIRITIFPEGENPDPEKFDYLYQQAKNRGFKVFANPAQHSGGQRVASRSIANPDPVKNDPKAALILIDRVKDFSKRYPCDWICPFNEDGKVDGAWSETQINQIFESLHGKVNGADLIGPCTWGIPAGIDMIRNSSVAEYITVATTHNLGHNHEKWREFIRLARSRNLPVWDSEVNTHKKFPDRPHRLHAALESGVDGLVLYHAWKSYVNLNTGELTPLGLRVRKLILKDPDQYERSLTVYRPREGDVLFQSIRRNPFIDMIEGGAGSPCSHCGLLVRRDGQWMVLEAMEAVIETPIQEWRARGRNQLFDVYRFRESFQKHIPETINETRKFLGHPYDARYQMDDSRIYGAELIYKGYKNASGRELGKLMNLSDVEWKDQKEAVMKMEASLLIERKIVTSRHLSESTDLKKVFSAKETSR